MSPKHSGLGISHFIMTEDTFFTGRFTHLPGKSCLVHFLRKTPQTPREHRWIEIGDVPARHVNPRDPITF